MTLGRALETEDRSRAGPLSPCCPPRPHCSAASRSPKGFRAARRSHYPWRRCSTVLHSSSWWRTRVRLARGPRVRSRAPALRRRPLASGLISLSFIVVLILLSQFKHEKLWMTVDFVDLMIIDRDTSAFLTARG